eukprot:7425488-Alexandrium_andersonii.AAC.1
MPVGATDDLPRIRSEGHSQEIASGRGSEALIAERRVGGELWERRQRRCQRAGAVGVLWFRFWGSLKSDDDDGGDDDDDDDELSGLPGGAGGRWIMGVSRGAVAALIVRPLGGSSVAGALL